MTGDDRPGIAAPVFRALAALGLAILDVEQVRIRGHLLLCFEVAGDEAETPNTDQLQASLIPALTDPSLSVSVVAVAESGRRPRGRRQLVTVLAPVLGGEALGGLFGAMARTGSNVERIVRLSDYPVTSYELVVESPDPVALRRELGQEAARLRVDVAVQPAGLHRRAKHLIVMDVDSTLLQGEVIDLLAARSGHAEEVAALTAAAMAGDIDFETALRRRVALLEGLDLDDLAAVRRELALTPGARTLVRTLRRLGYVTALVSGGFDVLIDDVAADLGIDHVAANQLEIHERRVTGRLIGAVVDRAGKAEALRRFAALAGVPLAHTIAVGDGANDLDMLAAAGLGIAFNAKPVVRDAADTALNVPYLDAILYVLGISRDEVEAADSDG